MSEKAMRNEQTDFLGRRMETQNEFMPQRGSGGAKRP
jgi:hypothetical protein